MSGKLHAVKGMNDLLTPEVETWQALEQKSREWMRRYGYREIRTPILEDTALFIRSVGEETDIVGKEMYTFEDRGGRSVSMRPEGTAPAVRAYIEHAIFNKEPVTHWFYLGPMYRYERMKTGRYRQFWQLGAEAYGVTEPTQDVEVIELAMRLLRDLGLNDVVLHVNSLGDDTCRPAFQEKLREYLRAHKDSLCADSQNRIETNPLRVLDCKNEECRAITRNAPNILDALCDPCRAHLGETRRQLELLKIPYELDPKLVRGLDYYTRTAFEFLTADPVLGTASAVGGGGRYDKLIEGLGGPAVPGVGWAMGVDRLCILMGQRQTVTPEQPALFVAWVNDAAKDYALKLVSEVRGAGIWVELDTRGGSLKSQMKRADKSGARFGIVIGESEMQQGKAQLKPLAGGEAREVTLSDLVGALKG